MHGRVPKSRDLQSMIGSIVTVSDNGLSGKKNEDIQGVFVFGGIKGEPINEQSDIKLAFKDL